MPTYLSEMLYRLCTKDLYSFFLQNKPGFLWIAKHWIDGDSDETVNRSTLQAVILHYQKPCSGKHGCFTTIRH